MGHIFDDSHAGMARQVLPVQPLEGLFSKTKYTKFRRKNDLFDSYSDVGGPNDFHFLYLMVSWYGSSTASSQLLEAWFTRNEYIKLVAMKLFIIEVDRGWHLPGSN